MDDEQRRGAKKQMMALMQAGQSWQEAAHHAGIQTSRASAYRWWQAYRRQGDAALLDGRHGHPSKVREPVLNFLECQCSQDSQATSRSIQKELHERFGLTVSITHLGRLRKANGRIYHAEKKTPPSLLLS